MRYLPLLLVLAGCASSQQMYTPDGQQGHTVSCSPVWSGGIIGGIADGATSWAQCYQKAGEICGERGYTILQQLGEGGARADVGRYGGSARTTNNRMMVIQCKGG